MCKKKSIHKMCLEIIYLIYMYKKNLALNNLQWAISHKTKPNKIIFMASKITLVRLIIR